MIRSVVSSRHIVRTLETQVEPGSERKKKKNSHKKKGKKKVKISQASDSSSAESDAESSPSKKHCIYHGWCSHTSNKCKTLKELIRKSKQKQKKGYAKKAGKSYKKQELNAFFKKKLKKALKVGKEASRMQELRNFENMNLNYTEKSSNSSVASSSSKSS